MQSQDEEHIHVHTSSLLNLNDFFTCLIKAEKIQLVKKNTETKNTN